MKKYFIILIAATILGCSSQSEKNKRDQEGIYSGEFRYGNFDDHINFEIERDSTDWKVYFTSLEQNAFRIPAMDIQVNGDSINFKLESDLYTYTFCNKWVNKNNELSGSLTVDTLTTEYKLQKEPSRNENKIAGEDVIFESNKLKIGGTIWSLKKTSTKGIVFTTSSGEADRSGSRAEAILFAEKGFTTFHFDKRGTGISEGSWQSATIEELSSDDINAIVFFSKKVNIPLSKIGIKGSSQGGAKIPYILNNLEALNYGIVVSCPGATLLESDLNYWKTRNIIAIGMDIGDAVELQKKVFEFIAGKLKRADLETEIDAQKSKSWFSFVWIPDLDKVQIDKKLLFTPIPYFQKTKQPVLIVQGTLDEIIPSNSYEIISKALQKANNSNYKTVLLEGASHSMYYVGKSDFPYWSKLHPEYLKTMEDWINTFTNNN